MRVLINGGAGFIGLAIAEKLKSLSISVCIIDTIQRIARVNTLISGVQFVPIKMNSPPAILLEKFDALVHLAWSSQPSSSLQNASEDVRLNVAGSIELFDKAINHDIKKIIFASSGGTVYGNPAKVPISELSPLEPVSAYGVSKLSVERYLRLLSASSQTRAISLRVGNPYGPYQLHGTPIGLIANFLLQISKGEPLKIYGDGSIIRDYIWIEDVATAFCSAILEDIPSGEYNIGTGVGHSICDIANRVDAALGQSNQRNYIEQRTFDVQRIVLSTEKFQSFSTWRPRISLDEGLSRMIKASKLAE